MEESQKMTEETQKEKRGKRMEDNKIILYTLAVIESVIWGFSFVGTKAALVKLTPMEVITAHWTMAAAVLIILSAFLPSFSVTLPLKNPPFLSTF